MSRKKLLYDVDHYNTMMKNIDFLHQSSSRKMFKFLSEIMIEHWVMVFGEEKYTTWFESTYLTEHWDLWFVTVSGIPWVQPNHNPQESSHQIMKQTNSGKLHASTEYCIKHTITYFFNKILVINQF